MDFIISYIWAIYIVPFNRHYVLSGTTDFFKQELIKWKERIDSLSPDEKGALLDLVYSNYSTDETEARNSSNLNKVLRDDFVFL